MNLSEKLVPGGRGVIATASKDGVPNTAIYAVPHVIDGSTVAWGMTAGRTWKNLLENPNASYLYMMPGPGCAGVRLTLALKEISETDPLVNRIREKTRESVSLEAGESIRFAAFFTVTEIRPLV
ncbi:MAG TPA: pyridoxamine 5'-phosphate oxidase family protein [Candidatus Deferrimicrobiaceae bacterium]